MFYRFLKNETTSVSSKRSCRTSGAERQVLPVRSLVGTAAGAGAGALDAGRGGRGGAGWARAGYLWSRGATRHRAGCRRRAAGAAPASPAAPAPIRQRALPQHTRSRHAAQRMCQAIRRVASDLHRLPRLCRRRPATHDHHTPSLTYFEPSAQSKDQGKSVLRESSQKKCNLEKLLL